MSVQKALRSAYTLATLSRRPLSFSNDKIQDIANLINEIKGQDVNLDRDTVSALTSRSEAPVTYIHIWEDDVMSAGIFLLQSGARIPLHDHPHMFGFCKVVYGNLSVESHSHLSSVDQLQGLKFPEKLKQHRVRQDACLPVKSQPKQVLNEADKCCILTPDIGNFHEIGTEDGGPAAFFDILVPPYDHETGARMCQYYRLFKSDEQNDAASRNQSDISWLVPVSQPQEFWCDSADYQGPPIDLT